MAQNTVTIIGNLTRDPELRFTQGGQAVASFGVAINSKWTDRQTNQPQEKTEFFDVTAWGSLGENASKSLRKGDRVIVDGKLSYRQWQTQDGENRSKVEITADSIGPDLRFAEVAITKNPRATGYQQQPPAQPQPQQGYQQAPQRPTRAPQSRPAPSARPPRPQPVQPTQGWENDGWTEEQAEDALNTAFGNQTGYYPGEEEEPF